MLTESSSSLFVATLAWEFDPLKNVFLEHLDDNDGETLPHMVMSDYCRLVLASRAEDDWVNGFLQELETNFSLNDDDEVSNVIAASFVKNLPAPNVNAWPATKLGSKLSRQYNSVYA